jgi:hypothetical protein
VTAFACRSCGNPLSGELRRVELPTPAGEDRSYDEPVPLVGAGTYAVEPGAVVLHPGDVAGVQRHPDRARLNGCCDLDGLDGPNLVCARCGDEVATQRTDCWVGWSAVRLHAEHVVDGPPPAGR